MKPSKKKKVLVTGIALIMALSMLTGCESQVGKSDETSAKQEASDNTAKTSENEGSSDSSENQEIDYGSLSADELQKIYEKEPVSKRTINVGYDGGVCQAAVPLAYYLGYFEDEGITAELVATEDAFNAIAAGKIDTTIGMVDSWLTPAQNGIPLNFTLGLHTGCAAAYALADSDISGFEKGQKIGVNGAIGGDFHNVGLRFVYHDGLESDDFEWQSWDSGALLSALQQKQSDIIITSEQQGQKWVDQGLVKLIRSQSTDPDFKDQVCCVLGVSQKFREENPATAFKLTRAVYRASQWLAEGDENLTTAAKYLIEKGYTSGEVDYNVKLMKNFNFQITNEAVSNSLTENVKELKAVGTLKDDLDVDYFRQLIWHPYENLDSKNYAK